MDEGIMRKIIYYLFWDEFYSSNLLNSEISLKGTRGSKRNIRNNIEDSRVKTSAQRRFFNKTLYNLPLLDFPSYAKVGDVHKDLHDPQIHPIIGLETYEIFLV